MRSRTLQHPGIEWFERDLSQFTDEVNSTTSLIMGFTHQGKSNHPYEYITSTESLKNTIGEPKTEAERYAYYAAKRVLTQKGKLVFWRIPYANEMEKVVPAFRYSIDEDTMSNYKDDKAFIPTTIVTDDIVANLKNMGMEDAKTIADHLTVETTKSGSNKVFPGYATVTKLTGTDSTGVDKTVDLKKVWGTSAGSARFVVLVDSEEGIVTGKCSADEDSRFIAVSNVTDKTIEKTSLVTTDGKDWKGGTAVSPADKTAIDAKVLAALRKATEKDEAVFSGDVDTEYTVKSVRATAWNRFEGTTDNVEGMYLTKGVKDGFYPSTIVVTLNAAATYSYKETSESTDVKSSADLPSSAKNVEYEVTITVSQAWDGYLRTTDSNLDVATLYVNDLIDTSTISGISGFFGKGAVPEELSLVDRIVRIHRYDKLGYVDSETVNNLRDGDSENLADILPGTGFVLVNSSNHVLKKDTYNNNGEEVLGIVPFVFTGFNKLAGSSLITPKKDIGNTSVYQAVHGFETGSNESGTILADILTNGGFQKQPFTVGSFDVGSDTISNMLVSYLPTLVAREGGKLPGDDMNNVSILVAELKTDPNYDNKVVVTVRELFTGNWDKDSSNYIQKLVNENSEYVELYTNYTPSSNYTKDLDKMITVVTPTSELATVKNFWFLDPTYATVMGFKTSQTEKLIKYRYITDSLDRAYNQLGNIDELDIDVVVDAGLTSIANLCVNAMGGSDNATGTKYNTSADLPTDEANHLWFPTLLKGDNINSTSDIAVWKTVASKLNTFCEVTRKDCIAYIDAPRNLTLNYDAPVVKKTGKKTIDANILPRLKYMTGLNSTYGSLNTTWVKEVDDFSGAQFWCPPSVLKVEKTVWADQTYGYPWYVSVGTERGTISDAIDVSMNPYPAQEDVIYSNGFNYVKSFKNDGIVIWGQKTLQSAANTSMLGRENVRRMFLFAERRCYKAMKKFLFQPITTALMNRVCDTLNPIMQDIQDHEGCYDYKVLCNSQNNTAASIMRNELRVGIAIHATPLSEYVVLGFLCVGLTIDITEELIVSNT